MSKERKRYILDEDQIPREWYNIQAEMPVKPLPALDPATKKPLHASDLFHLFAKELCEQEFNQTDP